MVKKRAIKKIQRDTQITIYETGDGKARVEVRFEDENVWLTQAQMSELFDRDQSVISKHIKVEMQAARGKSMTMKDWTEKLNAFLKFSEYEILTNAGKISHEVAEMLALGEYEKYKKVQDKNYISDFDMEIKKLLKKAKK